MLEENPYKKEERKSFDPEKISQSLYEELFSWQSSAFQARALGEVASVWEEMVTRPKMFNVLGYAASLSSAGMWPAICWLIKNRFIDVLISTGANITEDIYEAMNQKYWKVDPYFVNDEDLLTHQMDRFYDHAADEMEYRKMEKVIVAFLLDLNKRLEKPTVFPTWKLLYEFGLWLKEKGIWSILAHAADQGVPVFSPALVDSGFGEAYVWAFAKVPRNERNIVIEQFWDAEDIFRLAERSREDSREKSAGYIGGGVPKDFAQLVAVSQAVIRSEASDSESSESINTVYPYKYSFQITTDSPQWGGLSGCGVVTEPISWGKEASGGRNAQVFVDATIALRLILSAFKEKGLQRNDPPDLLWFLSNSSRE